MAQPTWIDGTLSEQLPSLRDRGEGQHLEFMEKYPSNGHDLSKEIAAFASSNAGTILIGVGDDGKLVGVDNVDALVDRDKLQQRIEGVCSGHIRPAITPTIKFAQEEDATVVAIEVPRGSQPIYYSRHTPYVRHLSSSRPAHPHEVIERVTEWIARTPLATTTPNMPEDQFLSRLAQTLTNVLIYGGELEERNFHPWLELVKTQLGAAAAELRDLAAEENAIELSLDGSLREIADNLEAAANHRLVLGRESWPQLTSYVADAVESATAVKEEFVDTAGLSVDSRARIADMVRRSTRQLEDLDRRAESMADEGRMSELQAAASEIGRSILFAGHLGQTSDDNKSYGGQLLELGRILHLLETKRLFLDGGRSMRRIVGCVHDLTQRLQKLVLESEP